MLLDYFDSPIGLLEIRADMDAVTYIGFADETGRIVPGILTDRVKRQLSEYFSKERKSFDFPIRISTTDFRGRVYEALMKVPYGSVCSYRDLTFMAGNRRGFQATGQAVHHNPLLIVIPCHRVIRQDGSLGGFAGRLEAKRYLLHLEGGYVDETL